MNRLERAAAVLLSCPALPAIAAAADGVPPPAGPVSVAGLLQVLLALAVVLAAIALFAWVLRRWMPGQAGASGFLRVVGGVMIGPKERLVLVEMGETWLLLGVAANHVNLLHSMPRPVGVPPPPAPASEGFARLLKRAVTGRRQES
jgi:flagellar protein FliO/FliZ